MPSELNLMTQFIRSAAFLRREFLGRNLFDEEGDDQRDRTIYLFDTDVISTFCQPWEMGPSEEERHTFGYGEIFPYAGERDSAPPSADEIKSRNEVSAHIAAILAEHVFGKERPEKIPAYQFDEHFSETKTIYEQNARHFADLAASDKKTPTQNREEKMRRAAAFISATRPSTEHKTKLLPEIEYIFEQMHPLNYPTDRKSRQIEEWDRFLRLNAQTGGIYPASLAGEHFKDKDESNVRWALAALKHDSLTDDEKNIFSHLEGEMYRRLCQFGSSGDRRTDHDAQAIAHLYLINARMVEKATGWRAVFVTGARSFVEACYGTFPQWSSINLEVADRFSQKFVRHLWAYTTEALLEPDLDGRRRFINWLDGLLASESGATYFDEAYLTQLGRDEKKRKEVARRIFGIASGKLGVKNVKVSEIYNDWHKLTGNAVAKHRIESLGLSGGEAIRLQNRIVARITQGAVSNDSQAWKNLTEDISEEYHRSKDRTFLDFSTIGKNAVFRANGIGQRNPPDLAFESLTNSNRIFNRLCDAREYSPQEYSADFEKIADDCPAGDEDNRQLSHLQFLVLGATFAGADKWGVALSQGKRALSIIERSRRMPRYWPIKVKTSSPDEPDSYMSGREAHFLCASAARMIARNMQDFVKAEEHLINAEKALIEDKEKGTAKKATFVRFKCERLALALSRYYLQRKQQDGVIDGTAEVHDANRENTFCDDMIPPIYAAVKDMLEEISKEISKGKAGNKIEFSKPGVDLKRFGRVTLMHISTNIVQVCVIRAFRRHNKRVDHMDFPLTQDDLRQALRLMAHFSKPPENNTEHQLRETPLVRLYRDAGARILSDKTFPYESKPEALGDLYDKQKEKNVASYDEWRFKKLRELSNILNIMESDQRQHLVFD